MDNFEFTKQSLESLKCSHCTNPYDLIGICQNFHYICSECQRAFSNCPICTGPYLPEDDLLMDIVLRPVNEAQQIILRDAVPFNTRALIEASKGRIKKSPVEKCKEHFFLAVWESLTELVFSGLKNKGKKKVSVTESVSKILSKVTSKMGKSIYDWVLLKNPDRKTLKVSLCLLALLIGGQLVLQKVLKGTHSTPTVINIPGESLKKVSA